MHVYEKVKAFLDDNGIRHVSVAKRTGIPVTTFNSIINGKKTLYADDFKAICQALQVSPEIFIRLKQV